MLMLLNCKVDRRFFDEYFNFSRVYNFKRVEMPGAEGHGFWAQVGGFKSFLIIKIFIKS